jgi:hypothetical protein
MNLFNRIISYICLGLMVEVVCLQTAQAMKTPPRDVPLLTFSGEGEDLERGRPAVAQSASTSSAPAQEEPFLESNHYEELSEELTPSTPLEQLKKIEAARVSLRWASVDWTPHRLVHLITTFRWMKGHGDPTENTSAIKRAYFKEEFLEGAQFIVRRGVQLGITALILAQLVQVIISQIALKRKISLKKSLTS